MRPWAASAAPASLAATPARAPSVKDHAVLKDGFSNGGGVYVTGIGGDFAVPAGSGRGLVAFAVYMARNADAGRAFAAPTFGGAAMVEALPPTSFGDKAAPGVAAWLLPSPPVGAQPFAWTPGEDLTAAAVLLVALHDLHPTDPLDAAVGGAGEGAAVTRTLSTEGPARLLLGAAGLQGHDGDPATALEGASLLDTGASNAASVFNDLAYALLQKAAPSSGDHRIGCAFAVGDGLGDGWLALRGTGTVAPAPAVPAPAERGEPPEGLVAVNVSTDAGLTAAIGAWQPGQKIVLAGGTYALDRVLAGTGGEAQPFLLMAAERGTATLTGRLTLEGAYPFAHGLRCEGAVTLKGTSPILSRSWVDVDAGRYDPAVAVLQATDPLVVRCDVTGIGQGIDLRPDGDALRRPVVRRCYVHDIADGTVTNGYDGLLLGGNWAHTGLELEALVEFNLFENVSIDTEAISNKSASNVLRFNHLKGCKQLSIRHGRDCELSGNTIEGGPGLYLYGQGHLLIGNECLGGAQIFVGAGTRTWAQWAASNPGDSPDYPAATDCVLIGNQARLLVGKKQSFVATDVAATNTRIEAHKGTIAYDLHKGTVVQAATALVVPAAVRLAAADVGPDAP
ncbi:MAG: hypothetical protein KDG89_11710 [Geminicoccaceae bacterium]|nr:hypothetical protein [Geminicoccaceae bacterium]